VMAGRATETDRSQAGAVCGWFDLVMGSSTAWLHNLLTIPTLKGEAPPVVWMIDCGGSRVIRRLLHTRARGLLKGYRNVFVGYNISEAPYSAVWAGALARLIRKGHDYSPVIVTFDPVQKYGPHGQV
jgi:hypothetical protein